jgi:hypothetical protein
MDNRIVAAAAPAPTWSTRPEWAVAYLFPASAQAEALTSPRRSLMNRGRALKPADAPAKKSMVTLLFATLIFCMMVWLAQIYPASGWRLAPRHDESRACRS